MNEVHSPTVVFSLNWAARMEGGDLTRHGYEQFDLEATVNFPEPCFIIFYANLAFSDLRPSSLGVTDISPPHLC